MRVAQQILEGKEHSTYKSPGKASTKFRPENFLQLQTRSKKPEQFFELPDNLPPSSSTSAVVETSSSGESNTIGLDQLLSPSFSPQPSSESSTTPPSVMSEHGSDHGSVVGDDPPTAAVTLNTIPDFVNPTFFNGDSKQDATEWLQYLLTWFALKGIAAVDQVRFFALMCRGLAADWFESLEDEKKDTMDHIQEEFKARFFPTNLTRWQTMSEIWSRKQKSSESVDEYVSNLLKLARQAGITDADTKRYAAIKGFLPEIRKHVLQQNPTTMAEVMTAAKVAEQSMKPDSQNDVILAMSRLEEKFDSLAFNKPEPALPEFRSRSPTTLRSSLRQPTTQSSRTDSYQDDDRKELRRSDSSTSPRRQPNDYQHRRPEQSPSRRPEQSTYRSSYHRDDPVSSRYTDRSSYNRSDQSSYRRPENPNRQPTASYRYPDPSFPSTQAKPLFRHNYENQSQGPRVTFANTSYRQPNSSGCFTCGRFQPSHPPGRCPAFNVLCYSCGKKGHYSRACRSKSNSSSQHNY